MQLAWWQKCLGIMVPAAWFGIFGLMFVIGFIACASYWQNRSAPLLLQGIMGLGIGGFAALWFTSSQTMTRFNFDAVILDRTTGIVRGKTSDFVWGSTVWRWSELGHNDPIEVYPGTTYTTVRETALANLPDGHHGRVYKLKAGLEIESSSSSQAIATIYRYDHVVVTPDNPTITHWLNPLWQRFLDTDPDLMRITNPDDQQVQFANEVRKKLGPVISKRWHNVFTIKSVSFARE